MYKILDMSDDERVNYLINNNLTKTEKGFIARLLQFNEIDSGNQFHRLAIDVFTIIQWRQNEQRTIYKRVRLPKELRRETARQQKLYYYTI